MPYPEFMVAPMREDLVKIGFTELRSPEDVDRILGEGTATTLVALNSVCGCAAGMMRPAVSRLHHRLSAVVTLRGALQGRRAGLLHGAPSDRRTASRGHRGGPPGGIRGALLTEVRTPENSHGGRASPRRSATQED